MRKASLSLLIFLAGLTGTAMAQSSNQNSASGLDDTQVDQITEELKSEESPPPPEPPYPGSDQTVYAADPSAVQNSTPEPAATPNVNAKTAIPRPIKIDENEHYYYGTDVPAPQFSGEPGLDTPKSTRADGQYDYDTRTKPSPFSGNPAVEKPVEVLSSGEYRYTLEEAQSKKAATLRFGALTPPKLKNPDNQLTYSDIYGSSPVPIIGFDYEFLRLTTVAGRMSLKIASGIATSSGAGHFRSLNRASETPDERYTFLLFPNSLTANYRFQFVDKQWVVPFIEGGGGYYTVAELRDDGKKPRLGGGPVGVAAGGFHILLDRADPTAAHSLAADYGINHIWLTLEGRAAVSVGSALDFTSIGGNAGFMMEF